MAVIVGCTKTMVSSIVVLLATFHFVAGEDIENSFLYEGSHHSTHLDYLKFPLQLKLLSGHRNRRDLPSSTESSFAPSVRDVTVKSSSTLFPSSAIHSLATPKPAIPSQTADSSPSVPAVTQDDGMPSANDSFVFLSTPGEVTIEPTMPNFTIVEDDHRYYRSRVATAEEQALFWVDEKTMYTASHHDTLSESYRSAATIQLSFCFTFYGHEVNQITVATGGFLYMSDFLHQWLTATQYIAPLMANFDTQLGNASHIRYMDNGTVFVVWWEDVYLQDNHDVGFFSFQVMLHKDGRIIFNYRQVPSTAPTSIPTQRHPVKVGLSDAYYVDKPTNSGNSDLRQRTIYEYHRVEINMSQVVNNSAIIITPLPTCLSLKTCEDCINMSSTVTSSFQCHWCPSLGKCSDGLDRSRQEWLDNECDHLFPDSIDKCAAAEAQSWMGSRLSLRALTPSGGVSVATAVAIAAVLLLVGVLAIWLTYAYKYPNSRSGLWLIQHRPNNLLEHFRQLRRGTRISSKYEVAMQPEVESLSFAANA